MDIRDFFNKCENDLADSQDKKNKMEFMNIIKKGLKDRIISIQDYEFIKAYITKNVTITILDKFINIIKVFTDQDFTKLFTILFDYIWEIIDNHIFSNQKMTNNMIKQYPQIKFTDDQINGILTTFNMLYDNNIHIMGLYGYAGTGKTTLITKIIGYLLNNKYIDKVAFTAPTHKALNVMKFKFHDSYNKRLPNELASFGKVEFITIHKLLGYKKDFNKDGNKIFVKGTTNLLSNYDVIIIDECSNDIY